MTYNKKNNNDKLEKRLSFLKFAYKKGKLNLDKLNNELAEKIKKMIDEEDNNDIPPSNEKLIIKFKDFNYIYESRRS